jgi:betaine-aldehyde dehydrogenase
MTLSWKRSPSATRWRSDRQLRARVLNAMADRIEARTQELIDLLSLDNGKVKAEAALEIGMVPAKLRYNAALALSEFGRAAEVLPGRVSLVLKAPMGVAGVITPWNSPVILTIRSLAPALAAATAGTAWRQASGAAMSTSRCGSRCRCRPAPSG